MALVTRKQVESNLGQVTSEQIGRCTKVYDFQLKANIYMVLSESDDLTEYRVTYNKNHHCFCCTCPSGENGFSNVKHPSGVCKHVRWSCAAAAEERAALAETCKKQAMADDIITINRLNDYQQIAATTPVETIKASALRTIAKILQYRGDVVLDNGKWIVATPVAA
jgi:hypothetical protein